MSAATEGFSHVWHGADMISSDGHAPWVTTPLHDTLHVVAQLTGANGETAAQGQIDLELQPDRIQGVLVWLSGRSPVGCFGASR